MGERLCLLATTESQQEGEGLCLDLPARVNRMAGRVFASRAHRNVKGSLPSDVRTRKENTPRALEPAQMGRYRSVIHKGGCVSAAPHKNKKLAEQTRAYFARGSRKPGPAYY